MARIKPWVLAFGCATLFLISLVPDVIKGHPEVSYHSKVGSPTTWPALLLDWAIITIVLALVFPWAVRRARGKAWLAIALPTFCLFGNRLLLGSMAAKIWNWSSVMSTVIADSGFALTWKVCLALVVVWVAVVMLLERRFPRAFGWLLNCGNIALISGALLGCITMLNLPKAVLRRGGDRDFAAMHLRGPVAEVAHPRLVWVLMDEFSYEQALGDPQPDLKMPNLDKLTQQSTVFTHVTPIEYYTDRVIPSLITGQILKDGHFHGINSISYYYSGDGRRHDFDPGDTVFADAEREQWNVGVAGWYIPYCTLLRGMLQRCSWRMTETKNPMRSDAGIFDNMLAPFRQSLRVWNSPPLLVVKDQDEKAVLRTGLADLQDPRLDFVYIHIPVPHPPATFDRHTGKTSLTSGLSYEDGLAHADVILGDLLQAAEASPRWSNTTLIVHGDHSWRAPMWVTESGWTPEDERISHGAKFDDRPLVLVHGPGQDAPAVVSQPVSVLSIHDLAESVIKTGKLALP